MVTGEFPRVSVQDVLNCSFTAWYPRFKKHTVKSVIIPLTEDVLQYLRADEFYLPNSANKLMDNMRETKTSSSDNEDDPWSDEENEDDATKKISFPEFEKQIEEVIDQYEAVFPKLNWSSPKDARWVISDSRLKCTNLADIFLLLKSSDFITHDLSEPFKFCHDDHKDHLNTVSYALVLRKWSALQPSKEFRCFVKNNRIIAVSQRDCENYYQYIGPIADEIRNNIVDFFNAHIQNQFSSADFVIDIYRKDANKLYIIDFNPWGPMTDGLLYQWSELMNLSPPDDSPDHKPDFRYIHSQNGIKDNSYTQYAMPKDIADITRQYDMNKLAEILSSRVPVKNDDSDSDEETKS